MYNRAITLCPDVRPTLIPNWLMIKNTNYSVLFDLEAMTTKNEEHACDEFITITTPLNSCSAAKLIPLPSFENNINPHYLILPYKKNFITKINDTNENTIIYRVYFQSMKCMNIINTNSLRVNLDKSLNMHFKQWIENRVSQCI